MIALDGLPAQTIIALNEQAQARNMEQLDRGRFVPAPERHDAMQNAAPKRLMTPIADLDEIDVSVVIVSWNTRDILRGCLNSIFEQTREVSLEVFVVDNNSHDGSAEMVRTEFPAVKLIANLQNRGF